MKRMENFGFCFLKKEPAAEVVVKLPLSAVIVKA